MHPFGGTPICPRCSRAVYAAEQVMGPGRKLYHKPCLACTLCNKRLDSLTLLEHDEQPYCKSCHTKNFGTRDLRRANLPHGEKPPDSPPTSPTRFSFSPLRQTSTGTSLWNNNDRGNSQPPNALRALTTGNTNGVSSVLRPTRSLTSPTSPSFVRNTPTPPSDTYPPIQEEVEEPEEAACEDWEPQHSAAGDPGATSSTPSRPSNTGRPGLGNLPRTVPLYLPSSRAGHQTSQSLSSLPHTPESSTLPNAESAVPKRFSAIPLGRNNSTAAAAMQLLEDEGMSPLMQNATGRASPIVSGNFGGASQLSGSPLIATPTGTRYGAALGGSGNGAYVSSLTGNVNLASTPTGSPRKWGAGTPVCPRCSKNVYFAEQVKAVGKTFHKNCLRCVECQTTLDSSRLRDHDGDPFCVRCYGKLHGPQGSGYALLGKAGG